MYSKPVWAERRAEIERFVEEGKGLREMAEYYGVKLDNIGAALKRLGLKMKPEDVIRRQRDRIHAIHNDPEKRAKWIGAVVERNKSPERRQYHQAQMRERWKDPEYRAYITEKSRQAHDDPEYRTKVREGGIKGGNTTKRNAEAAAKRKAEYDEWFKSLSKFEQQLELVKQGKLRITQNWNRRYK